MRTNRIVPLFVLVGVVIAAVTFLGAASLNDGKPAPAPVSGGVVVFGQVDVDNGAGLLQVYPEMFPQSAKVVNVLVKDENQKVKKGDKLIEFDKELPTRTVEEAEAGLQEAQAALREAQSKIQQADNLIKFEEMASLVQAQNVEAAKAKLKAAGVRLDEARRQLKQLDAESDPPYQAAKKEYEAAQHTVQAEQIKLEMSKQITPKARKDEAQAAADRAKAVIARQKALLEKAKYGLRMMDLTAPMAGMIIRINVTPGQIFGPQTREPAFLLKPDSPLIVRAEVDQEFASRMAVDQTAVIHDEGNTSLKWTGKVLRIGEAYLPKRNSSAAAGGGLLLNESRVLECVISIEGADPIRIGQRVRVSIGIE